MGKPTDDIRTRLLAVFNTEADEHLQIITANLMALEREIPAEQTRELVEATFREVHTLKGAARSVSHLDVEGLCQAIESILSRITHGSLALSARIRALLQQGIDGVSHLLAGSPTGVSMLDLINRLEQAANEREAVVQALEGKDQGPTVEPPPLNSQTLSAALPTDTIRVATAKLDALLLQAEDLLIPKLASGERVRDARVLVEALDRATTLRSSSNSDSQPPTSELRAVGAQGRELLEHLRRDYRTLEGVVNALQDEMRRLRLSPASIILDAFPRMVRDLAQEHGKQVQWVVKGADLEVDRKVLETVKEPLIHLVRNAIDHGIELPEAREQVGKSPQGRVEVTVKPLEGGRVEIRVEDDGQGMDPGKLRAAAIRTRHLTPEVAESLSDEAAVELAFRSGLSTSPMITNVSGHGLGLAIVKERVEHLRGQVLTSTIPGKGTTIRMVLPATVATFRGLLVQVGQSVFLLPLDAVERTIRIAPEEIRSVEGRRMVRWNDSPLPIVPLRDLLGLGDSGQPPAVSGQEVAVSRQPSAASNRQGGRAESRWQMAGSGKRAAESGRRKADGRPAPEPRPRELCVVLKSGEELVGLLVDEILGDREVLVKEFRPPLVRVRNIAGAGLLGTGQIVLILRPADLLRLAREHQHPQSPVAPAMDESHRRTILVVDDSITTRVMEKNLLEAAGYPVRVAVDGVEAWTLLKSEEFGMVVSDVDMPRMDGFALTARIRADKKLADLPIVLVTALESREDKERGIEVGANAYLVKSSFDQSNLLEIIRRLI